MAWALYLSSSNPSSVTDEQLAELDDFELASRGGPVQRNRYLTMRIANVLHALIAAIGAMNSRNQMLRSVNLLHDILSNASPHLLASAARGLSQCEIAATHGDTNYDPLDPSFLRPLVNIAVKRVSDTELSATAADSLAILLGCRSFDYAVDKAVPKHICEQADIQTKTLTLSLITEIVLTSSPRALCALANLLRRDYARQAFCDKDGISTLASTLLTHPTKKLTALGEIIASTGDAHTTTTSLSATYHAVFAIWMLSFAARPAALDKVLTSVLSARLVVVLARLLNHSSGQRLKIARVTLASLRNLASGNTELHRRVRRDLLAAEVPLVLTRLMRMGTGRGSLLGPDSDVMEDATFLMEILDTEHHEMSTIEAYVAEVQAHALHWSSIHKDIHFWMQNAQPLVQEHPDILSILAQTLQDDSDTSIEQRLVACNDLSHIMQHSRSGRRALLAIPGLKNRLMELITDDKNPDIRAAALTCVQILLLPRR